MRIPRWQYRYLPELHAFDDPKERLDAYKKAFRHVSPFGLIAVCAGFTALFIILESSVLPWLVGWVPWPGGYWTGFLGSALAGGLGCVVVFFRKRSRIRQSLRECLRELGTPVCEKCGYDLRGQVTPRCPECGRPFIPIEPE